MPSYVFIDDEQAVLAGLDETWIAEHATSPFPMGGNPGHIYPDELYEEIRETADQHDLRAMLDRTDYDGIPYVSFAPHDEAGVTEARVEVPEEMRINPNIRPPDWPEVAHTTFPPTFIGSPAELRRGRWEGEMTTITEPRGDDEMSSLSDIMRRLGFIGTDFIPDISLITVKSSAGKSCVGLFNGEEFGFVRNMPSSLGYMGFGDYGHNGIRGTEKIFAGLAARYGAIIGKQIMLHSHHDHPRTTQTLGAKVEPANAHYTPILGYIEDQANKNPDKFHIHIWASINMRHTSCRPSYLGRSVSCRDSGHAFTKVTSVIKGEKYENRPLIDDSGNVYGEMLSGDIGYHMFIYHDLNDTGQPDEFRLLSAMLDDVFLKEFPEQFKAFNEMRDKLLEESSLKRFVEMCTSGLTDRMSSLASTIRGQQESLDSYMNEISKYAKSIDGSKKELAALKFSVKDADNSKVVAQYKSMLKTPKVKKIIVDGQKIEAFTETLYCADPTNNTLIEIGEFKIVIPNSGGIKWFNLTRKVNGGMSRESNAPHVSSTGSACLGNASAMFADLYRQREFEALLHLAINFIEQVNVEDSAGQSVRLWPLVTDKEIIAKEVETRGHVITDKMSKFEDEMRRR